MRSDLPAVAAILLSAVVAGGCSVFSRSVLDDSAADRFGDADGELDFWDELATRRVVTNHDALHALLMMAEDEPPAGYDARLAQARRRGWVGDHEQRPGNESATLGMVAVAVCDLIGLEGGLSMRVLGPSPRVCAKELVYLGLIPPRTPNQSLSGLEFIDLLGRVEAAQAGDDEEES